MIEYGLLFGLGFLTAILAALLLAPAIHRRIVKFTEDRIMATMPVSPQELRAQKDMVRAEMAAAVARTGHDLKEERTKAAIYAVNNDRLSEEASRLYSDNSDLRIEMQEMTHAAAEMRASLRQEEINVEKLKELLSGSERNERTKDARITDLLHRIQRLTMDIDNLKIDLVTRDTEAESFRARINTLRDERETLRNDLKLATQRAKDAELRLAREENKVLRLEDKLNTEISNSVDKDTVIERRISEIGRLKDRLKAANADAREAVRSTKTTGLSKPMLAARAKNASATADKPASESPALPVKAEAVASTAPTRLIDDARASELAEQARNQASAAADMLLTLKDDSHDDALRQEIADIAAKMVAVVSQKEGMASPMRTMISGKPTGVKGRTSLSERASRLMHKE